MVAAWRRRCMIHAQLNGGHALAVHLLPTFVVGWQGRWLRRQSRFGWVHFAALIHCVAFFSLNHTPQTLKRHPRPPPRYPQARHPGAYHPRGVRFGELPSLVEVSPDRSGSGPDHCFDWLARSDCCCLGSASKALEAEPTGPTVFQVPCGHNTSSSCAATRLDKT